MNSCKKKGIDVDYTTLDIHEDVNIQRVIFTNATVGYACGGNKSQEGVIYKTNDAGASWLKVYSNNSNELYDIRFANDTMGYACGENLLLLKTIDGGIHWQTQSPDLPPTGYSGSLRNIYCIDANTVYVAGGIGYEVGITYKTFNAGKEWIYNTFDHELRSVSFINRNTGFYAGYGVVFQTNDSATNFQTLSIKDDFFVSMQFIDNHTAYACGYNGGIYKTSDSWNNWDDELNNNKNIIASRHFNNIQFANANTGYAVGNNGLIVYTDNGGDWQMIKKIHNDNLFSVSIQGNKIFISAEGGKIYRLNR